MIDSNQVRNWIKVESKPTQGDIIFKATCVTKAAHRRLEWTQLDDYSSAVIDYLVQSIALNHNCYYQCKEDLTLRKSSRKFGDDWKSNNDRGAIIFKQTFITAVMTIRFALKTQISTLKNGNFNQTHRNWSLQSKLLILPLKAKFLTNFALKTQIWNLRKGNCDLTHRNWSL